MADAGQGVGKGYLGGKGKGKGPCRYGNGCNRPGCPFQHPDGRLADGGGRVDLAPAPENKGKGKGPCRYGNGCNRPGCTFQHPDGRLADGGGRVVPDRGGEGQDQPPVVPPVDAGRPVHLELGGEALELVRDGLLYHIRRYFTRKGVGCRLEGARLVLLVPEGLNEAEEHAAAQDEVARLISLRINLTERVQVRQAVVRRLIGPGGNIHQLLVRDLGVRITAENAEDRRDLDALTSVEIAGPPEALERVLPRLHEHLFSFNDAPPGGALAEAQLERERGESVHIFVDNSNLSIGCQFLPTGRRDLSQRLNIAGLVGRMTGQRQRQRAVVVGSRPPRTHLIWGNWERAGFEVLLEWRDPETQREQFVDARLVGEALMHVTALNNRGAPPGVLILGTGDGNLEGQRGNAVAANFQNLVRQVAQMGWKVEVWTWRIGCHPCYHRMAREPGLAGRVKVCFLDGMRDRITFQRQQQGQAAAAGDAPDDADDLCVMCISNAPTHRFQPCGHTIICAECVPEVLPFRDQPPLGDCFICRARWTSVVPRP